MHLMHLNFFYLLYYSFTRTTVYHLILLARRIVIDKI